MLKWTHSNKEQYFYSNPEKTSFRANFSATKLIIWSWKYLLWNVCFHIGPLLHDMVQVTQFQFFSSHVAQM